MYLLELKATLILPFGDPVVGQLESNFTLAATIASDVIFMEKLKSFNDVKPVFE